MKSRLVMNRRAVRVLLSLLECLSVKISAGALAVHLLAGFIQRGLLITVVMNGSDTRIL